MLCMGTQSRRSAPRKPYPNSTSFYFDEHCLWHTTGEYVSVLPVGGWLQPMTSGGHLAYRRFGPLCPTDGTKRRSRHNGRSAARA